MSKVVYVPYTPAGSMLSDLEADTEKQAWRNLVKAASHMPYNGVVGFKTRGYTVVKLEVIGDR